MINVLSVDVEDWFHPSEAAAAVTEQSWPELQSRVVDSTRLLLETLESTRTLATFFVLGWVARRHPDLVAGIAAAGHELGCHSDKHKLIYDMAPEDFRADTRTAKQSIEDAAGTAVQSYRAPSYSITKRSLWALEILAEMGFSHDSSIYPVSHDRYGIPDAPRHAHVRRTPGGDIIEVPVAAARLSARRVAPVGGGAYFRIFPYRYTAAGIRRINDDDGKPACIYIHPWEFDPGQPRLSLGPAGRLRTYTGLSGMRRKLTRLLEDFRFSTIAQTYPTSSGLPISS